MPHRLTEEKRAAILKDWRAGMSEPDIAAKWGVGPTYARVLALRRDVPRATPPKPKASRVPSITLPAVRFGSAEKAS